MRVFLSLLLVITLSFNCNSQSKNDDLLKKYFTSEDISQINEVINFFDDKIMGTCESNDLDTCYKLFFKSFKDNWDENGFKIDTMGNSEFLNSISPGLFNKIWAYQIGKYRSDINSDYHDKKFIHIKTDNEYFKFLEELSKQQNLFSEYANNIEILGDIGPNSIAYLLFNYDKFNFNDKNTRFVFAVHYLTLGNNY